MHKDLVCRLRRSRVVSGAISRCIPEAEEITGDPSVAWVLVPYMLVDTNKV